MEHCALEGVLLEWNQTTILEDKIEMLALLGYFGGTEITQAKIFAKSGQNVQYVLAAISIL